MAQGRLGDEEVWEGGQDGAVIILGALDRLKTVACVCVFVWVFVGVRVYAHDVISESFLDCHFQDMDVCIYTIDKLNLPLWEMIH